MSKKPGKVIGLKVSRMDRLDSYDPTALATQMAQHMQNATQFRKDSVIYAERAVIEDKKANEMGALITQVNERRELRRREASAAVAEILEDSRRGSKD